MAGGAGIVLLAFAFLAGMAARQAGHVFEGDDQIFLWVVAGVAAIAGVWLWKKGKQLRAVPAEALLAADPRPPVLYLRSFNSDAGADIGAQERMPTLMRPMVLAAGLETEEEQIAAAFSEVGPMVAIGRPGERLPQLGAARMYATEDTWQATVADLLSRSRLVVMRVGDTEGFWWEVANAATLPDATRVIFLLPETPEEYARFRLKANAHLPKPLPEEYAPRTMTDRTFGGMLWFDPDWTPHIALCDFSLNTFRRSVAADLREKLAPIFNHAAPSELVPATGSRRLGAFTLDILISGGMIVLYLAALYGLEALGVEGADSFFAAFILLVLVSIYFGVLEATPLEATPGKRILGLVTRDRSGLRLTLRMNLLRAFLKFFTAIMIPVALFTAILIAMGRRAPHDVVAKSVVLYRPAR